MIYTYFKIILSLFFVSQISLVLFAQEELDSSLVYKRSQVFSLERSMSEETLKLESDRKLFLEANKNRDLAVGFNRKSRDKRISDFCAELGAESNKDSSLCENQVQELIK